MPTPDDIHTNSDQASLSTAGGVDLTQLGDRNGAQVFSIPVGKLVIKDQELADQLLQPTNIPEVGTEKAEDVVQDIEDIKEVFSTPDTGISSYKKTEIITNGPNIVPNQPPHSEQNPKHKELDGQHPSVQGTDRKSFKKADYANPSNRNDPAYGPVETSSGFTSFLEQYAPIKQNAEPPKPSNTEPSQPGITEPPIEPPSSTEPISPTETPSPSETEKLKADIELINGKLAEMENSNKSASDNISENLTAIREGINGLIQRVSELENKTIPTPPTVPTQAPASPNSEELTRLREEMQILKGQNTPEQKSLLLDNQMKAILGNRNPSELSDQEKLEYFNLLIQKEAIDKLISNKETESLAKRERKEKIIKIVAFAAGAGLAIATPAVSVAAVVAVTLGGRFATPLINKLGNKIRAKANDMKYMDRNGKTFAELSDIDKKIKRNEWWANRLGELAAVVSGGTAGYGMGKLVQGLYTSMSSSGTAMNNNPAAGQTSSPTQTPTNGIENLGGQEPTSVLSDGKIFDTNGLGWDTNSYGWGGPRLLLNEAGGSWGTLQGQLLTELQNQGVTRAMLSGPEAGRIFANGLTQLYQGLDPATIAQTIASQL